jgi:hypothetical protein
MVIQSRRHVRVDPDAGKFCTSAASNGSFDSDGIFSAGSRLMNYWRLILAALIFSFGFMVAWKWQEVAYLKRESEIQKQAVDDLKAEREKSDRERALIEMARAKLIADVRAKQDEIDRLSNDVDAARVRLRILVKQVPGFARCDAGGTEPVAAELAADARQAYFDIRRGIVETEAWAKLCQKTVRAVYENQ